MLKIRTTTEFIYWLDALKDLVGRAKIQARVKRLIEGNYGNSKSVGDKVFEMKIDYGPGYRIYYTKQEATLVILLIGGNKSTQDKDIKLAKHLAKHL